MSVLVFAESLTGTVKKAAQEAVTYGVGAAKALGTECIALTIGAAEGAASLGVYGASKVYNVAYAGGFDAQSYSDIIAQAVSQLGATVVVFAHSSSGKSLAGRIAARFEAGMISNAVSLPTVAGASLQVKKGVFSGKAFATYDISSALKVITIANNTFKPAAVGADVSVENLAIVAKAGRVTVKELDTVQGQVPLPEADLVVSAGRGMKGPENWGIIEELA